MKRFLFLLVVVLFPCLSVYGQVAVIDATLNALIEKSEIEKAAYWLKEGEHWVSELKAFSDQLIATGKQIDMQMQNLASLKDVKNLDNFKDWYNRQLHLEQETERAVKGMNVSIGKKNYSLWDLQGIADGFNETYVEYWNNELSEDQRRELWISMGLTPANYAYVQPYRQKAREIDRQLLALSEIQNNKNKKYSEATQKVIDEMKAYYDKPAEEQQGVKEVLQRLLQTSIITAELLQDVSLIESKRAEREAVENYLKNTPDQSPELSYFLENAWGLDQ